VLLVEGGAPGQHGQGSKQGDVKSLHGGDGCT
jgi:hypothetical protein